MYTRFGDNRIEITTSINLYPLGGSLGLGKPFFCNFNDIFRIFSICPIFDLMMTTHHRHKYFTEKILSLFRPKTHRGVRTNLVI